MFKIRWQDTKLLSALVFLFLIALNPVSALEQISNGNFSAAITNPPWLVDNLVDRTYPLDIFAIDAGSFYGDFDSPGGGGADPLYYADGLLEQKFPPSVAKASDSIASISVSYFENADDVVDAWVINLSGTIRRDDTPTTILDTFLNRQVSVYANLNRLTWAQLSAYTVTIPGGYRYRMRFHWTLGCGKNIWASARVDNIKCNLSPSGLVASETAAGACALDWEDSTGVATFSEYRIYRRTSESDLWGAFIATSTTSDYTDNAPPASDTVYYAVTDVDTLGVESPKSPVALFKRAKIVISSVSATPTTVTIGQNGIPVYVTVTNTGFSAARLDSIELLNDPSAGLYNKTLQTPLSINLAAGESKILTFSVDVLEGSNPETDTLDAVATGASLVTGVTLSAPASLDINITHEWLIRAPANLVVQTITVPSTVYLDQKLVPVVVEVLNDGAKNAAAYWESVELLFSNGTYLNIVLVDPMPVTVYAGQTASVTLNLDVSPTSATGTCIIDANITFRDVNLLINSANYDGAALPGNWTVIAGLMKTYKGPPTYPSYTIPSTSFNQATGTVYARAENLIPLAEYRFRWYYPDDSIARIMDPPKTTDSTGKMTDELPLTALSPTGKYRVIATRVTSTIALAETYFYVVTPASLAVTIDLPPTVTVDQLFNATMTAINSGGAAVIDVTPAALTAAAGNTGTGTKLSGPAPIVQNVAGTSQGYFSWQFQADTIGSFALDGGASGYDANDSTLLSTTIQSNMCTIQSKPVLSVVSITEGYTNVYRNQTGLDVTMLVRNQGEATVAIDTAALVFSLGNHTQVIASPSVMPALLPGNSDIVIAFTVAVASDSPTGAVSITGSFTGYETNDQTATYSVSGGTAGAWTINAFAGKCAANSNFSPEQYTFNQGQTIFVEFTGATNGTKYSIFFHDTEAGGVPISQSGVIVAGLGAVSCQYDLPVAAALTKWRAEIWAVNAGGAKLGSVLGIQFFHVQAPGTLNTTLQIAPGAGVELGENITVTMSLSNTVANSSTIYPATPTTPILATGFTGNASLVSGPDPASISVSYGYPATFTWVFQTTEETVIASTFALIATATGVDFNTTYAATIRSVSSSATSNGIPIILRDLDFTPDPLNVGTLVCGSTYSSNFTLDNPGNVDLTSVVWQKSYPISSAGYNIPYSYFSFSPPSGFSVAAGGNQAGSFTITLPYSQPPGTYSALMAVYDDLNSDSVRTLGEPYQEFTVTLVASDCKVIMVNDEPVDLGGWPANSQTATLTFAVSNIGNLNLENLVFSEISGTFSDSTITVTPTNAGGLATDDAVLAAEVSAWLGAEAAGSYIATWTIEDLTGTYASDTFQIKFSVGDKNFTFATDPYDLGNATPTYTLGYFPVEITNTGLLPLTQLTADPQDLGQSSSTSIIPFENILFEMPTGPLAVGATMIGTLSVYVPAGTPLGIFEGEQYFFDDENGDGLWSGLANEPQRSFLLRLNAVEYYAIQVVDSTLDFGGVTQGETKTVSLLCRNIGNIRLDLLKWEKYRMLSGANEIPAASYSIFTSRDAGGVFYINAGELFYADASISVDLTLPAGLYTGENPNWLFNDMYSPLGRNATEPQSSFGVSCQVGSKIITILEAGPLTVTGFPSQQTAEVSYSVKNDGTLVLATPKAAAITPLIEDGLVASIPASAVTFNPELFDYINPGQTKYGLWSVLVPPGQQVGTYTGTIQVWDDSDNSGAQNGAEPADTVGIVVSVLPKRVLTVTPSPLDLYFIPPGQSVAQNFLITNAGNVDITGGAEIIKSIVGQLNSLSVGPPAITQVEILPSPISSNLLIGESVTAIASVTIPANQTTGPYEGTQKIYIDKGSPGDGIHDSATEEYATFTLKLTVGQKILSITPTTLDMGSLDPLANSSLAYTVKNETSIPLSCVKFYKLDLGTGVATMPTTAYSFNPAGPFTISSNGSKAGIASLTVPAGQSAGIYVASLTVFEDDSGEGEIGTFEASATFQLKVTVNAVPKLTFTPGTQDLGIVNAGSSSGDFEINYLNSGNVALSNITWNIGTLTDGGTETITDITFSGPLPSALAVGASGTAVLKVGPIPSDQKPGIYTGSIEALYDTTMSFIPPAMLYLTVEILGGSTVPDLASGSAYQEIATTTWAVAPANEPWIMSAWVSLESNASAALALIEVDSAGAETWRGIKIDSSGNLNPYGAGPITGSGVVMSTKAGTPPMTWHRVYFSFDYSFDITTASNTYMVLQNTTEDTTASRSVWFDGVQLERAGKGQTRPSPYTSDTILVSPNRSLTLDGKYRYYER
ncbi:MAG: hypothetical protein KKB51_07975 [Candidatus Riflebacteria bacterium]|nr:hypothetical protein [Candidatus Riflebacteria bacterium]